jgi:hypothetical protein
MEYIMSILLGVLLSLVGQPGFPLLEGMTQEVIERQIGRCAGFIGRSTLPAAHTAAIYSSRNIIVHYNEKGIAVAIERLRYVGCE